MASALMSCGIEGVCGGVVGCHTHACERVHIKGTWLLPKKKAWGATKKAAMGLLCRSMHAILVAQFREKKCRRTVMTQENAPVTDVFFSFVAAPQHGKYIYNNLYGKVDWDTVSWANQYNATQAWSRLSGCTAVSPMNTNWVFFWGKANDERNETNRVWSTSPVFPTRSRPLCPVPTYFLQLLSPGLGLALGLVATGWYGTGDWPQTGSPLSLVHRPAPTWLSISFLNKSK